LQIFLRSLEKFRQIFRLQTFHPQTYYAINLPLFLVFFLMNIALYLKWQGSDLENNQNTFTKLNACEEKIYCPNTAYFQHQGGP
jgi:hypothetical protein